MSRSVHDDKLTKLSPYAHVCTMPTPPPRSLISSFIIATWLRICLFNRNSLRSVSHSFQNRFKQLCCRVAVSCCRFLVHCTSFLVHQSKSLTSLTWATWLQTAEGTGNCIFQNGGLNDGSYKLCFCKGILCCIIAFIPVIVACWLVYDKRLWIRTISW